MAYPAQVLRVMIASPGDVEPERRLAEGIIYEWNATHSAERAQVLLPVAWETHASPALGERAQGLINRELLQDADLLVAMFWTRIGTPTGTAVSGTVEEIEENMRTGKPTMIYFSNTPVVPDTLELDQVREVRAFREKCLGLGLVETYDSISEFADKFRRQLRLRVIKDFPRDANSAGGEDPAQAVAAVGATPGLRPEDRELVTSLSIEARQLLKAASHDKNGVVLIVRTLGGTSVQTHGRNFTERGNARSEARWCAAADALAQRGLLEQRDRKGEVFAISNEGFRVADLLSDTH